ncbi:DUF551 domain-containing protein [Salmonella enterica subsp. enterica]|nr:DUF551 domain-containing protein [Salmonella enterica subsp. enterica]
MTTITKEWLQQTIAEFENTRDDIPFGLSDDDAKILLVLKRALASLDAEPVRYLNKFSGTCVTLEQQPNAADDVAVYMPLYAAPPAPAGNEFIPKNLDKALGVVGVALPESKEEFNFQIERWIQRLIDRVIRYADEFKEQPAPVVPEEAYSDDCPDLYASQPEAWAAGWNACRAALLHDAEPVSQTYELPQTQFEQVADLYEMQFDDGRTCAFHTDGAKAAQWLLACDGNKVQEYVRLERYHEALIGNSPVIPDDWVMVPKEPTQAMINAWLSEVANWRGHVAGYKAALAAAPQQEMK